jgi:hypothetical protein
MDGFREKVAAEVAGIADVEIDVTPNLTGFREKVAAETARLSDVDVNVAPDTTGFREKVKAAVAGVGSMDVPITVDTTRADVQVGAFATRVKTKLDAAIKSISDFRFGADQSEIDRAVASIRAKLVSLSQMVIKPGMDGAAVLAEASKLEAELKALLSDKTITIKAKTDINDATVALTALRKSFSDTERDGNLVSRAFGGLVTAIGSGISSLGSFVGSASSVGSALTSMGGSVTGASGSFASLGQNIGSALSSALPFLATAAQWTAMGIAIAGAGAVAVGGIGQIGGAAIALASGIVPLVTSLGLLPGLLAPVGIGLGTLALGFSNTGKSGIEFKTTMDQLKTAFTPVVDAIRSQMQPAVQSFIQAISGLAPVVQQVLPQITAAVSQVTNTFSQIFRSSSFKTDLQSLLSGAALNIQVFGDAARNAFQGFINIMVSAQPAVNRIAVDIDQVAQKFNAWTTAARQSGELTQIFQQAATVLEQLGNTVVNIAGLFVDLWNSANRTGAFTATLNAINTGITQFRDYVNQAGGAWDQLMSKAGAVTTSLVGLVGAIGNAFVELGNSIDITGVIDSITTAINNMTPAFAQIGAAAAPVFENIITIIGRMVEALGPVVTEAITALGTAIQSINWEGVTVGVATFIKGMSDIVSTITTVGEAFQTFEQMINQVESGDFAGAGESLDHLGQLWADLGDKLTDTSSIDAARTSVSGLNATIQGVQQPTPVIFNADGSQVQTTTGQVQGWIAGVSGDWNTKFTGDASGVQGTAGQAQGWIVGVSGNWDTKFTGDASGVQGAAGSATASANGVPTIHTTTFTGDGAGLLSAAAGGQSAIQGVVPDWLTKFAGDAANLSAAVSEADSGIQSIPVAPKVMITGDASSVTAATTQTTTSLSTLTDKNINITAVDNASAVATTVNTALAGIIDKTVTISVNDQASAPVGTITGAINAVPDHTSTISINDQATNGVNNIRNQINSLQDKTVTITVRTVQTNAAGGLFTPMASGGVLGMAPGGHLTAMSAGAARIVPPNTWRVIGDRMVGDEAFIPINGSSGSVAILGATANRMGYALAPMAGGGFSSRDGRAWDWLAELLRRHHHGHGGGGGGSGGGTGEPPPVPDNWGGSGAWGVALRQGYATTTGSLGSGITQGVTRPVTGYARTGTYLPPTLSTPPGGSSGPPLPPVIHVHPGGSRLDQMFVTWLRQSIQTKGGGSVQAYLGSR